MKQSIDCDVKTCKYCNNNKCILNCIKISRCNIKENKESTMCTNYKKINN